MTLVTEPVDQMPKLVDAYRQRNGGAVTDLLCLNF